LLQREAAVFKDSSIIGVREQLVKVEELYFPSEVMCIRKEIVLLKEDNFIPVECEKKKMLELADPTLYR